MLITDLIKELQTLEKEWEDKYRYHEGQDMLGPAEILIDLFEKSNTGSYMKFAGITGEIKIILENEMAAYVIQGADWNR